MLHLPDLARARRETAPRRSESRKDQPASRHTALHLSYSDYQRCKQPFRLLDLPTGLLLQVLALAVINPDPICVHGSSTDNPADGSSSRLFRSAHSPTHSLVPPPITRVNRLLREEGLKLFYRKNVFHGVNWSKMQPRAWMKRVDERWRREMRVVISST